MAQWQLTAEDLLPVIDKINKTADDFPVTSQDLVDGLNRSSGAARVMGLTLEENDCHINYHERGYRSNW